jgi:opacity protein-like surface antigen
MKSLILTAFVLFFAHSPAQAAEVVPSLLKANIISAKGDLVAMRGLDSSKLLIVAKAFYGNECQIFDQIAKHKFSYDGKILYKVFGFNLENRVCTGELNPVEEDYVIDVIRLNPNQDAPQIEVNGIPVEMK